eukprot:1400603-Prymnesium_polylepis.1
MNVRASADVSQHGSPSAHSARSSAPLAVSAPSTRSEKVIESGAEPLGSASESVGRCGRVSGAEGHHRLTAAEARITAMCMWHVACGMRH